MLYKTVAVLFIRAAELHKRVAKLFMPVAEILADSEFSVQRTTFLRMSEKNFRKGRKKHITSTTNKKTTTFAH